MVNSFIKSSDAPASSNGVDLRGGGAMGDAFNGGAGNDIFLAGDGDDVLNGGSGINFLEGDVGADKFVLDTGCAWDAAGKPVSVSSNLSHIVDFTRAEGDKIVLDLTGLPFLDGTGKPIDFAKISSNWFSTTNKESYVYYDQASGKLFYDKDAGSWDHQDPVCCTPCEIAVFDNRTNLTADDFVLVNQKGVIWGLSGNDTLVGGAEANTLRGGAGLNTLTGGLGADKFVMDTGCVWDAAGKPVSSATNLSHVTDFSSAQGDKIVIDRTALPFLSGDGSPINSSSTPANWFSTTNKESYIYYDQASGALYYDKDAGSWDHSPSVCCTPCQIAILDNRPTLTAADFTFA